MCPKAWHDRKQPYLSTSLFSINGFSHSAEHTVHFSVQILYTKIIIMDSKMVTHENTHLCHLESFTGLNLKTSIGENVLRFHSSNIAKMKIKLSFTQFLLCSVLTNSFCLFSNRLHSPFLLHTRNKVSGNRGVFNYYIMWRGSGWCLAKQTGSSKWQNNLTCTHPLHTAT